MKPYTKENLIDAKIDYHTFLSRLEKEVIYLQHAQQQRSTYSLTTNNPYYNGLVFLVTQIMRISSTETSNERIAERLYYFYLGYGEERRYTKTALHLLTNEINQF